MVNTFNKLPNWFRAGRCWLAAGAWWLLLILPLVAVADHTGCGDALGNDYFADENGCWGVSHKEMVPRTQALMGVVEQYYPQLFPAGESVEGYDDESYAGSWIFRYYIRSYPKTGYSVIAWYDTSGYGPNWYAFSEMVDGPPVMEQLDVHLYLYHPTLPYMVRLDSLVEAEHELCADAGGLCLLYYMR